MNITRLLLLISLVFFLLSCKDNDRTTKIRPYDNLSKVDELLKGISRKPQIYYIPSGKSTKVIGDNGTIIHVDPSQLETIDRSPIGDTIEVELLEFTDKYSLITNNIQTISDQEILVTGGAYYINMTSNGKQLKVSEGIGISVEFPKLSDDEMALFLGERDSLGQVNWIPTQQKLSTKNIENPQEPVEPKSEVVIISSIEYIFIERVAGEVLYEDEVISAPKVFKRDEVTEDEYQEYLKELEFYNKRLEENNNLKKTYQAIEILNFGWINCDRFYTNPNPKTNIELTIDNDSINNARFFAIFDDINSILTEHYWINKQVKTQFRNIPVDMNIKIIGLSVRNSIPLWFITDTKTILNQSINVEFEETTHNQIEEYLKLYAN